ncbi:MAG: hypothetical protein MJ135_02485 [Oscillospiraceae bacterium]|nr:hypothetical protein [Oscillospiraceae bacterium]
MKTTRQLAICAMISALGVVLMLLGYLIGIGTYAAPILVSLCMLPVWREFGTKPFLCVWIATSILSLTLIRDPEQTLMFFAFFGWYPAVSFALERLPKMLRLLAKLLIFNTVIIAVELLLMKVIAPEAESPVLLIVLLVMGNGVFLLYDLLIPRFLHMYEKRLRRFLIRK